MTDNYAYSEVLDVLDNMETKYKKMLPKKIIKYLNENADNNYKKHVNTQLPLREQNISKDAITILAMINLNYWVKDEKHKIELLNKYKSNNVDTNYKELKDVFKMNEKLTFNKNNNNLNTSLVVKKTSIFDKIKNYFSNFKKSK